MSWPRDWSSGLLRGESVTDGVSRRRGVKSVVSWLIGVPMMLFWDVFEMVEGVVKCVLLLLFGWVWWSGEILLRCRLGWVDCIVEFLMVDSRFNLSLADGGSSQQRWPISRLMLLRINQLEFMGWSEWVFFLFFFFLADHLRQGRESSQVIWDRLQKRHAWRIS